MNIGVSKEKWDKETILSIQYNQVSVSDLPKLIGESFMKLASYIEAKGGKISAPPFAAYRGINSQNTSEETNIQIEIGFPISEPIADSDKIKCYNREAMEVVTTTYQGDNAVVDKTYLAMKKWAEDNGYVTDDISYENYLSDETVPVDRQLTKVSIPIIR